MKGPHCSDATLVMTDRQGIEIDYCPQCRGVWLDRGELDKLIERSASLMPIPPQVVAQTHPQSHPQSYSQPVRRPDFSDSDFRHKNGYRKQKSWLNELFD